MSYTTVYSTRFLLLDAPSIGTHSYTVPSGYLAVLRDVDAVIGDSIGTEEVAIGINGVFFANAPAGSAGAPTWSWRGRQIANPGDTIDVGVGAAIQAVAASGYLLVLP